ncbi:MAG: multidrug effflux MFS transporter [Pseudomonadota bacterium]
MTFLLAAMTAVAPLIMQMYLPALPSMARELGVSASSIQLTFSAYVFTVGPAQLLYGPIADYMGRRRTALLSLTVSLAGSLLCAMADSLSVLVIGRIVQALGAAGGLVVSRAVLSDRYGYDGMAERLSMVISVIVIVPMISPLVGGYLTEGLGWPSVFVASSLYITVVGTIAFRALPETMQGTGDREPFLDGLKSLIRKPLFAILTIQSALSLSLFYTFIAVVPYLLEVSLGYPPTAYGKFFVLLALGYMGGTFVSSRIASRFGMLRMIQIGTTGASIAAGTMLVWNYDATISAWSLFLPMSALAFANGLSSPSMQSGAVLQTKRFAGTASGVVGCLQQLIAGLAVQLVAINGLTSSKPMVSFIATASTLVLATTLFLTLHRHSRDSLS